MQNIIRGAWLAASHLALLCTLAACEADTTSATALVLSVMSDLDSLSQIEVAVFPASADPSRDTPGAGKIQTIPAGRSNLPMSIVVSQGEADEVLVAVRALGVGGQRLAENRLRARFVDGESLAVPVFLGGACRAVLCDERQRETCYTSTQDGVEAGRCGPIPLVRDLRAVMAAGGEHSWTVPLGSDAGLNMDATPGALPDAAPASDSSVDLPKDDAKVADVSVPDAAICMKPPVASAACGLAPQCGCAAGQACRLSGADKTECVSPAATANPPTVACERHEQCGLGYSCLGGRCSLYCQSDAECGAGGACLEVFDGDKPVPGVRACLISCNPTTSAPCGQGTACARLSNATIGSRTVTGNYCLKPATDCRYKSDGKCDEPEGTRLCVEGSDAVDCTNQCTAPPTHPAGGSCDLVRQCGCPMGQTCRNVGATAMVGCEAPGTVPAAGSCTSSTQCPAAYGCVNRLCAKYCATNADCGANGICLQATASGQDIPGVKTCGVPCSPADATSCPSGYVCANIARPFCTVPSAQCPASFLGDGQCDEPDAAKNGTRLCADGTDPMDCQ